MTTRQDEYITLLDDCLAEVRRLTDDYAAATHLLADRDAHIERLKAELATLRASAASVQADQRAEIDAANAALDELRADAERYRWLRAKSAERPDFYSGEESWMVSRAQGGMGQNFFGEKIDAAIDAARVALKGDK